MLNFHVIHFVYCAGAVGGDETTDEDKEKAEEEERERQEAIREAEDRRKEKHRKMEEEREKMRQEIRDKVSMSEYIDVHGTQIYVRGFGLMSHLFSSPYILFVMAHNFLHLITYCLRMDTSFKMQ